jgi:hypothetical protein
MKKTPEERREYMRQYMAERRKDPAITAYNRAASAKWRIVNRERGNAMARAWRAKNKDRVKAHNAAWVAAHTPEERSEYGRKAYRRHRRAHHLNKKFGLTAEQYEVMVVAQNGHCAICTEEDRPDKRLAVDHNHKTGKIRALLCDRCNRGIGYFYENSALLRKSADYLDSHNLTKDELLA